MKVIRDEPGSSNCRSGKSFFSITDGIYLHADNFPFYCNLSAEKIQPECAIYRTTISSINQRALATAVAAEK